MRYLKIYSPFSGVSNPERATHRSLLYALCLLLSLSFGSCAKFLDPENDNHSTFDRIYREPAFAEGLLITAYAKLPTNNIGFTTNLSINDVATDDAVTNNKLDNYLRMATGEWSALSNPVSQWDNCNSAILYLNSFINVIDTVAWKWSNPQIDSMFVRRFKGETYALRGLFEYYLLANVGGVGADGTMLGIPLYRKFLNPTDNFNVPRATFAASVDSTYADFDRALKYFTMDDYKDVTLASQLPPGLTYVVPANYNVVFGSINNQRICGRIVKAMKARLALLAASPAFNPSNDPALWKKAADYAGASITGIGGIAGLDPFGHRFYEAARIDAINLATNTDQKEMLWRKATVTTSSREQANYPPKVGVANSNNVGYGIVNPTQNLVDAFPALNGYPISNPLSNFNPLSPYANRDPRLGLYIVYNGSTFWGQVITTSVGGAENAKDSIPASTRTGYYMRKLLREDVNAGTITPAQKKHYEVHIRWTELFLAYAEAANEAYGPDGSGTYPITARQVIAAIRKRAGITPQTDPYLASITTQDAMRTLIRNERRLELCFEGFRFWDLRRWKADLTETAKGINIDKAKTTFTTVNVESRVYNNSFMDYGPIPAREVIKYNALIQNKGW